MTGYATLAWAPYYKKLSRSVELYLTLQNQEEAVRMSGSMKEGE